MPHISEAKARSARENGKKGGEPPIFGVPADQIVRIRMTPDQKRDLRRAAEMNHTDLPGALRQAIEAYVSDCLETCAFVPHDRQAAR